MLVEFKMNKIISGILVSSLSFSAMAECQPVGVDQNGTQLYRCDQAQVVQVSPPVYQQPSQMSSTDGMIIGAIGGVLVGTLLNDRDYHQTNVYYGNRYVNEHHSYRHQMHRY